MIDTIAALTSYRADLATSPRRRGRVSMENRSHGPAASARVRLAKAVAAQTETARTMADLRRGGMTFQAIADTFNAQNILTRHGRRWSAANAKRVLEQYA
jgi:hypothetical protein